jgi:ubiquinone/menaquinone biosynthesis C-methylase UbiE
MFAEGKSPSEMSIVHKYFEARTAYWHEIYGRHDVNSVIHQERRALVLSLAENLGMPPRSDVLEVGCGAGIISVALAQMGYAVQATDLVASMLEHTRQAAEKAGVEHLIETKQCDVHHLPFPNDSFDLVMAIGVLPWLPSLDEPMREMVRVLRPDGYLIVTTDNRWRLSYLLHPFAWARIVGIRIPDRLRFWKRHNVPLMTTWSVRAFDAQLPRFALEKLFGKTLGFGPFWMLDKLLPQAVEVKLHRGLQYLAGRGVPLLRSAGGQYITVSRKVRTSHVQYYP